MCKWCRGGISVRKSAPHRKSIVCEYGACVRGARSDLTLSGAVEKICCLKLRDGLLSGWRVGSLKGWAQSCLRNEEKLAGCEYLFWLNTTYWLASVQQPSRECALTWSVRPCDFKKSGTSPFRQAQDQHSPPAFNLQHQLLMLWRVPVQDHVLFFHSIAWDFWGSGLEMMRKWIPLIATPVALWMKVWE